MKITVQDNLENAPRKELIRDFNKAFAENNIEGILALMADDITWKMVGDKVIQGKDEAKKMLESMGMEEAEELIIETIVTQDDSAAANGEMKFGDMSVAFCDVYKFTGNDKDSKIKQLTSYGVELK